MPTSSWTRRPWNQRRKKELSAFLGGLRTLPRPLISASWKRGWKKPRSTWQSKCMWQRLRDLCLQGNHCSGEWSKIRKTLQQLCREAFLSVLAAEKCFCLLSSLLLFIWPSLLVKNEVFYTVFVMWQTVYSTATINIVYFNELQRYEDLALRSNICCNIFRSALFACSCCCKT